jgi:hypothetical protein
VLGTLDLRIPGAGRGGVLIDAKYACGKIKILIHPVRNAELMELKMYFFIDYLEVSLIAPRSRQGRVLEMREVGKKRK